MSTTLDFALVVQLLKEEHNVPARVTHSNGNTATIHAGSVENGSTYPVICGPGWFNETDFTAPVGSPTNLYIGRVAYPPHDLELHEVPPDATEATVAQLIADMSKGIS